MQSVAVAGEGEAGESGRFAQDAAATYPRTSQERNPHPTADPAVLIDGETVADNGTDSKGLSESAASIGAESLSSSSAKSHLAEKAARMELVTDSDTDGRGGDSDGAQPQDDRTPMEQHVDWLVRRQTATEATALEDRLGIMEHYSKRQAGEILPLPPRLRLKSLLESQRPDLAKIRAAWIIESGRQPVPNHQHLLRETAAPPVGEDAFEPLRVGADVRGKAGSWQPRDHRLALPAALRDTYKQERSNAVATTRLELERTMGTLLPSGIPMDVIASIRRTHPDHPIVRADEKLRSEAASKGSVAHA